MDAPQPVTVDDEFAKSLGLELLDKLKEMVKERLEARARRHVAPELKRQLLDQLDETHKFTPPPSLVEDEFDNVWRTIMDDLEQQKRTFADENTTEEKAREEYRSIAERRVRLGLVIAEIGERNNIKVTDEELTRAVVERARQFPGRSSRSGTTSATIRAPSPACARRSSRTRWSTSSSNSPR